MSQFVLLPWEYPFSGHSPKPHATARLKVGGKSRNFVLKIHDGILYFKEPGRGQVFVIFDEFAPELLRDSIGLISKWQRHVSEGNFGALFVKRDYFPKLPVRAQILMVFHANGGGWMKEHFDTEWFLLPEENAAPLDVWNDKAVEVQVQERFVPVQRQLINRALTPEILAADSPRWNLEDGDKIASLVSAAASLFVSPDNYWNAPDVRYLKIRSHSAFAKGEIEGQWLKHALRQPKFETFWNLLDPRIQFLGIHWSEGGENLEHYGRKRAEKIFQAGLEKWGHLWRGNWGPQRASFKIDIPDATEQTSHEKLEAALTLREWLSDKMPASDLDELLN